MYHFTYENQGTNTYLVYRLEAEEVIDTMSLGMLTNNRIKGLAATYFMQMNANRFIKFNVSSKMSASQLFAGPVNRKRLLGVFGGIVDALLSAEDYMIDTNTILLDLDYIFTDVSTCETVLICIPVMETAQKPVDVVSFLKQIMFGTQFDQTENCDHVTRIINYLNGQHMFSLADFKALLDNIAQSPQKGVGNGGAYQSAPPVQQSAQSVPPVQPASQAAQPRQSAARPGQPFQPVPPAQPARPGQPVQPVPPVQPIQPEKSVQPAKPAQSAPAQPFAVPGGQSQDGFAIPGVQPQTASPASSSQSAPSFEARGEDQGKPMSMFYLLQHYNKENAELYKAQKAAQKDKKAGKEPAKPKKDKGSGQPQGGFSVPGSGQPQGGFAMPGSTSRPSATKSEAPAPQPAPSFAQSSAPFVPASRPQPAPAPASLRPQPTDAPASSMDFGDTVIAGMDGDDGSTVILGAGSMGQSVIPHLIRRKNNERIPINKALFRLGRDVSFNDYVIQDNKYVGHSHCHIIARNGEYYIVDDNSKNHTYLDNVEIPPNTEVKIAHGQCIRLSNEEFEFRLF